MKENSLDATSATCDYRKGVATPRNNIIYIYWNIRLCSNLQFTLDSKEILQWFISCFQKHCYNRVLLFRTQIIILNLKRSLDNLVDTGMNKQPILKSHHRYPEPKHGIAAIYVLLAVILVGLVWTGPTMFRIRPSHLWVGLWTFCPPLSRARAHTHTHTMRQRISWTCERLSRC